MSREIRIVTINTAKCDGPYFPRREALAHQLRALHPDVIALQESFSAADGSVDTAHFVGRALGMHVAFAPARRKWRMLEGREVLSDSGMALLTRHAPRRVTSMLLPYDPRDGDRVAQIAILSVANRDLAIVNAHLCHLAESPAMRAQQLASIAGHLELKGPLSARLLVGDLNATWESCELQPLISGQLGWNVRDAWPLGQGSGSRATVARRTSWQRPRTADRCIDFILSLAMEGSCHPSFRDSTLVLNMPYDQAGVYPSDHFGVATTVQV